MATTSATSINKVGKNICHLQNRYNICLVVVTSTTIKLAITSAKHKTITSAKNKAITSAKSKAKKTTAYSKIKAKKRISTRHKNPSSVQKLQDTPTL